MNSEPGPHPEPPRDFHSRTLPITTHGGSLFRTIYTAMPLCTSGAQAGIVSTTHWGDMVSCMPRVTNLARSLRRSGKKQGIGPSASESSRCAASRSFILLCPFL